MHACYGMPSLLAGQIFSSPGQDNRPPRHVAFI
jgi:hypothetical protein